MSNKNNIIKYLYNRGLIAQIIHKQSLINILQSQSITLYCGFDPTADSLHIGHLVPLLCLRTFQIFGHHPIVLLGGATGLIGDPSFKHSERKLNSVHIIQEWIEKIKLQISLFIDCSCTYRPHAHIVNNYDWFSSMSVISFLRDIGKFFSINRMINKDAIKIRLQRNNYGISYTEFSYNLIQSYDFYYLYKNYQTILQIGGSDQLGNIISGIDLIHRVEKKIVYGLTTPLITTSNNIKFGKTEQNAIWLDAKKTSPYKFYQYWINSSDEKVYYFLKIFTSINIEIINMLKKRCHLHKKPIAQIILAEQMTQLVHGKKGLQSAQRITKNLFTKQISTLTLDDYIQLAQDGLSTIILKPGITLQDALVKTKLASSRTQARALINSNAITINKKKQLKTEYIFCDHDRLYNRYTLLKCGKKNYYLIQWK